MKSIITILLISISSLQVVAQTFQKKLSWRDNSFSTASAQWADLDNDGLLDVVVSGKNKSQDWQIKPFKNASTLEFTPAPVTTYNATILDYAFTDINRDNFTDLVMIAKKQNGNPVIISLINKKNFGFALDEKPSPEATNIHFADLDNDGLPDVILTGSQSLKILKTTADGFIQKYDSSGLIISGLSTRDFNKDGKMDIVLSGKNLSETAILFTLFNEEGFKFKRQNISHPHTGILETGDINHDGLFDLLIGSDDHKIRSYIAQGNNFTLTDSLAGYSPNQLFSADFNSDGLVDLSFSGRHLNGDRFSLVQQNNKTLIPLDTTGLTSQQFGDYDRDGDLDLLRVIDSADYHVFHVLENTTIQHNANPAQVSLGFGINTPQGTFIYWEQSSDDHTAKEALTYDLFLFDKSGNEIVSPDFDLSTQHRKRSIHGSQTTNQFAIIKGLSDQQYSYSVQAIDNAFNGGSCKESNPGTGCSGLACNTISNCFDIKHVYVQVCKNTPTVLTTELPSYWFSMKKGFIGISATYNFVATKNDTLYSFIPKTNDCSQNRVWVINLNENSVSEKQTHFVCENTAFKLGIHPGWKNVLWTIGQETSSGDSITLKIAKDETVLVKASSEGGCAYQKEFILHISKPSLTFNGEAFTISKGQSIDLLATGAKSYVWQPGTGLNNAMIANPKASPLVTTDYSVVATDSVGCKTTGKVVVNVQEMGFIPNLFTPNSDGKNDDLRIYGITEATQFKFSIFSREGTVMYETKDVNHASRIGWDGTHGGTIQNNGLYYWKIEGSTSSGEPLTLNGKSSGSVLLVK